MIIHNISGELSLICALRDSEVSTSEDVFSSVPFLASFIDCTELYKNIRVLDFAEDIL